MNTKLLGGILLIIGTSIGGGMLALPIANAATGFWPSSLMLILCWGVMTLGALFTLEVNLYLPRGKNMISMAQATLGPWGKVIAWVSYLVLLNALLSAYVSGGADVLSALFLKMHIKLPEALSAPLFTLLFGLVVYRGIRSVDYLNRAIMVGKFGALFLLFLLISPHIELSHLMPSALNKSSSALMLLITSFGFAIIVPNLREYFNDDIKLLRQVIVIGSLIPLACYLVWDAIIIGTINPEALTALGQSQHATSGLILALQNAVHSPLINQLFAFFASVSMLTAFLGVSMALLDFLADGTQLKKQAHQGHLLFALTFVPPLLLVMAYPGLYLYALSFAGIFCVILLILLPALMSLKGRDKFNPSFQVPGGKFSQLGLLFSALILLLLGLVT